MDYGNAISNLYKSLRSDIISVILNWLYTFRFWTYFLGRSRNDSKNL